MKIFVGYSDYGSYEGCGHPEAVFDTENQVRQWMKVKPEYRTYLQVNLNTELTELEQRGYNG